MLKVEHRLSTAIVHSFDYLDPEFDDSPDIERRYWGIFSCTACGGVILVEILHRDVDVYPKPRRVDRAVPERAAHYLREALDTTATPSACIMAAAAAVDQMLKERGYNDKKSSLNSRILAAVEDHVLTDDMGAWAHHVRLEANEERHADEEEPLPSIHDAQRCVDFAIGLAEYLFVLPARVTKGIESAGGEVTPAAGGQSAPRPLADDAM